MVMREEHYTTQFCGSLLCRPGLTTGEVTTELSLLTSVGMSVLMVILNTRCQEPKSPEKLARPERQPRGSDLPGVVKRV